MKAIERLVFALCTVLLLLFGGSLFKQFGSGIWTGVFIVPVGLWLFAAYGILRGTYADIKSPEKSSGSFTTWRSVKRRFAGVIAIDLGLRWFRRLSERLGRRRLDGGRGGRLGQPRD